MPLQESTVAQIADLLRDTKTSEPKACLLIGAGVSYSAGIGLAGDFITRIKNQFPALYQAACQSCGEGIDPNYAQCMATLPPAQQVKLVRTDIDSAQINWAHIGIARLEKESIVDTILTPNFDPLASRACALFNRFPAIYDLAGLRDETDNNISFDKSFVKGGAIFHLHGQHTGFLLLNTEAKLKAQAKRIRPVLEAVMKGKPVIIAGTVAKMTPWLMKLRHLPHSITAFFGSATMMPIPPATWSKNCCRSKAVQWSETCRVIAFSLTWRTLWRLRHQVSLRRRLIICFPY